MHETTLLDDICGCLIIYLCNKSLCYVHELCRVDI